MRAPSHTPIAGNEPCSFVNADTLLQTVVKDGNVDYAKLESGDLDKVLEAIATASMDSMSQNEAYAFLINAYNLCTLDVVRRVLLKDGKQVRNLNHKWTWLRFFFGTKVTVAGESMSLYKLEFKHIKPHLRRDPRGHFALVCASTGCPPLRGGVFHGDTLDEELDMAGKSFCQPDAGYVWYNKQRVLYLNRIFKWYAKDFKATGGTLETFLRYAPIACAEHIQEAPVKIKYLTYDWNLNAVKP